MRLHPDDAVDRSSNDIVPRTRRGGGAATSRPGAVGDVTILSGDVLDATPDEIRAMEVVATIVDGIVVHCSDAEVCD